jgi:hypothetical protein
MGQIDPKPPPSFSLRRSRIRTPAAPMRGDEGGIVCHLLSKETDNVIILSVTHARLHLPAVCHSGVRLPGQEIEETNGRAIGLMKKRTVTVNDTMQRGYRYQLAEPAGRNFDPEFHPGLTPKQMLRLGVFGGKYMTDARAEFPNSWFAGAKLATAGRDSSLNYFGVHASQPLSTWRKNGWIHPDDPRGWFQWYCRYYMGRRTPEEDHRQISRWKAMRRHVRQVERHCEPGDTMCRKRQRQALLHWAYDSRTI